jgi:hypothetical protein
MKRLLLLSTCVLALGATPALAQDWAVTLDGSYVNANANGFSADGYAFDGAAAIPLGWSNLSVEADLGDRGLSSGHNFDGGGSLVWSGSDFRVAGTVIYNQLTSGGSINETQYGGGGEWYASPWLTAHVQGGGVSGFFNAGYVGGGLKAYVMPDLSIDGTINYVSLSGGPSETDYNVHAEWLVSESIPLAVHGGYTRADLAGTDINLWSVGLKLYLNGNGNAPLVEQNRTGTLDTIGAIHPAIFTF